MNDCMTNCLVVDPGLGMWSGKRHCKSKKTLPWDWDVMKGFHHTQLSWLCTVSDVASSVLQREHGGHVVNWEGHMLTMTESG